MSLFIILCSGCGNEIPTVDKAKTNRKGEILCDVCVRETFADVPFA